MGVQEGAVVHGFAEMEARAVWLPVSRNTPHPTLCAQLREGLQGQGMTSRPWGDTSAHMCASPACVLMASFSFLLPTVAHEHLKERGLFGLPPPGTTPSDYYHQMTLMAGHPGPYGDLLMQSGGAASAPHLHDYLNPVDGECWAGVGGGSGGGDPVPSVGEEPRGGAWEPCFDSSPQGAESEQLPTNAQ